MTEPEKKKKTANIDNICFFRGRIEIFSPPDQKRLNGGKKEFYNSYQPCKQSPKRGQRNSKKLIRGQLLIKKGFYINLIFRNMPMTTLLC
jgi:hypothetical protein